MRTFGADVRVTRCSNNYGPRQFPEKLIPVMIEKIGRSTVPRLRRTASRSGDWIHVDDHNRGVLAVLESGRKGEVYHLGGDHELTNLQVLRELGAVIGREPLLEFVSDRPGHDRRYAMDCSKIQSELGWSAQVPWRQGLAETVAWYEAQTDWLESIRSGAYQGTFKRIMARADADGASARWVGAVGIGFACTLGPCRGAAII